MYFTLHILSGTTATTIGVFPEKMVYLAEDFVDHCKVKWPDIKCRIKQLSKENIKLWEEALEYRRSTGKRHEEAELHLSSEDR